VTSRRDLTDALMEASRYGYRSLPQVYSLRGLFSDRLGCGVTGLRSPETAGYAGAGDAARASCGRSRDLLWLLQRIWPCCVPRSWSGAGNPVEHLLAVADGSRPPSPDEDQKLLTHF
jgi:hypothetical protein